MKYLKLFENELTQMLDLGYFIKSFIKDFAKDGCRMRNFQETEIYLEYIYNESRTEILITDIDFYKMFRFNWKKIYNTSFSLGNEKDDIQTFLFSNMGNNRQIADFPYLKYDDIEKFKKEITKENFEIFIQAKKYNL